MTIVGYWFLGLIIGVCGTYLYFRRKEKKYNSAVNNSRPTTQQPKVKKR